MGMICDYYQHWNKPISAGDKITKCDNKKADDLLFLAACASLVVVTFGNGLTAIWEQHAKSSEGTSYVIFFWYYLSVKPINYVCIILEPL